ncbi:hypothetical protein [Oerskovia flava]|uniref:hypothetical protein n=1 Tax=Oerskovia flava TaxID=2986422 RepID=UPI00223EB636|nr:hypothetical protein [Oerskovia sp. JB1-3-2]
MTADDHERFRPLSTAPPSPAGAWPVYGHGPGATTDPLELTVDARLHSAARRGTPTQGTLHDAVQDGIQDDARRTPWGDVPSVAPGGRPPVADGGHTRASSGRSTVGASSRQPSRPPGFWRSLRRGAAYGAGAAVLIVVVSMRVLGLDPGHDAVVTPSVVAILVGVPMLVAVPIVWIARTAGDRTAGRVLRWFVRALGALVGFVVATPLAVGFSA